MTVCERPQFRPGGRSYSAEAIIRLTAGSSPARRASSTFPPGLWVPLSLYASLPLSVFVSPFGLPDVPGYLPLLSLVQGTKATTRKEVRGEIKGWRWKRTFTAIRELHKQLGRFCDILYDMECPVSPLLIFGNAAGVVMIGHYVGLRRRTYFTFFFFLSWCYIQNLRVPMISSDRPLSKSSQITTRQWTTQTQWHKVFSGIFNLPSLWKYIEFRPGRGRNHVINIKKIYNEILRVPFLNHLSLKIIVSSTVFRFASEGEVCKEKTN